MIYLIFALLFVSVFEVFAHSSIISSFMVGLGGADMMLIILFVVYLMAVMIGAILSGYLIDQVGAKFISIIGLFAVSGILVVYLFVHSPGQLLTIRFVHGLFSGFLFTSILVQLSTIETSVVKGSFIKYSACIICLASFLGSSFGVIMSKHFVVESVFYSISLLIFALGVVSIFIIKEPKVAQQILSFSNYLKATFVLVNQSVMGYSYSAALLLMFTQGTLHYLLPQKIATLGESSSLTVYLLTVFILVSSIVLLLPTKKLFERFSTEIIIIFGMLILSLCLFMISFINLVPILYILMTIYGFGFACVLLLILQGVVGGSSDDNRGIGFGLLICFMAFGVLAGSFVTGVFPTITLSFLIGGFILALCSAYYGFSIKLNQINSMINN